MDIGARIRRVQDDERRGSWRGSFSDYLDIVRERPEVADLSHRRIYRMLRAAGGAQALCQDTLFGLSGPLAELEEYFAAAAQRFELRKRILLLLGPVGGGKSTLVDTLKRGLEAFSRTEEGALYGIAGCPMHEEPLHLVPPPLRAELSLELGVQIEGDVCPVCAQRLRRQFEGDPSHMPVERIFLSEQSRVGIGTFAPSDPKSQDISELTGSLDLSTIGEYGVESDPRAFRFDGEQNVASRGLMEFVELLKCDERFLYTLLTLAQEGRFKTGRYAMLYADEVVIGHTNEAEYRAFIQNPRNEALRDRIVAVRVPYILRIADELRVYERLIRDAAPAGSHFAPHALEAAAMFAVSTRMEESQRPNLGRLQKMLLYDGRSVPGMGDQDRIELLVENPAEGMRGVSPRYVVNQLGRAVVRADGCLSVLDALRALKTGLREHPAIAAQDVDLYQNLLHEVWEELASRVEEEVYPLFISSFQDRLDALWRSYLDAIEDYLAALRFGRSCQPERERMMRDIEEEIGVGESQKRAFREEIGLRDARQGHEESPAPDHPALRVALERHLFAELQGFLRRTLQDPQPAPEDRDQVAAVERHLVDAGGYCPRCAGGLIRQMGGPVPFLSA
ncbi:MAG: protein prkA [Thermaerobacter sp.]|nr:protein prkA [Thermaerobacter sp.]